jgi:hypothetical protein
MIASPLRHYVHRIGVDIPTVSRWLGHADGGARNKKKAAGNPTAAWQMTLKAQVTRPVSYSLGVRAHCDSGPKSQLKNHINNEWL